jgi:hypothetical protein
MVQRIAPSPVGSPALNCPGTRDTHPATLLGKIHMGMGARQSAIAIAVNSFSRLFG